MPKPGRLYIPLDVNFFDDPRVVVLNSDSQLGFIVLLCFAKRMRSGGRFTVSQAERQGVPTSVVTSLHNVNLLEEDPSFPDIEYRIVGWENWNGSGGDSGATRGDASSDGTRGNHIRHHVKKGVFKPECELCVSEQNSRSSGEAQPDVGGDRVPESGRSPVEKRREEKSVSNEAQRSLVDDMAAVAHRSSPPEFESFWHAYPKRVGKPAAIKAWTAAVKRAPAGAIIDGAVRYALERRSDDPKYTKHPSTWLNQDCWDDEPVASVSPIQRRYQDGELDVEMLIEMSERIYGDDR